MMKVCLTIDADWAIPEVVEYTLQILHEVKIPYTFFATDDQHVVENECREIAWHPDLVHQDLVAELTKFSKIFPNAKGLRPHRFSSTQNGFGSELVEYNINWISACWQADTYTPNFIHGIVPNFSINWGDNLWFLFKSMPDFHIISSRTDGVYIINFHPIHIYLNTWSKEQYDLAKPYYKNLCELKKFCNDKKIGVRDIFYKVFDFLPDRSNFYKMSDAVQIIMGEDNKKNQF